MTAATWWGALTWAVTLAASILGGWWLVPAVLRVAARTPEPPPGGPARTERGEGAARRQGREGPDNGAAPGPAVGVLRGGTWIGLLERLALTASILLGFPTGAAVVVAVKGLGRYPELRAHPDLSERFVIGTLASLVWAGLCGAAGAAVIAAL